MFNKTKKYLITIITFIILLSINPLNTFAHNVELENESYIHFPFMIINGEGKINIYYLEEDYNLYYQWVEIEDSVYSQIKSINEKLDEYENESTVVIDDLENQVNIAKTAWEETKTLDPNSDETKLAYTEYQAKVEEYKDFLNNVNKKLQDYLDDIRVLKPTYVEDNWILQNDGELSIELTSYSGKKSFVLWAKLESAGNTYYNETLYTLNGTKKPDVAVESVNLSAKEITLKKGKNITLTATVNPSNATNKAITWKSEDENIATVENGKVTAKSVGTTTITVTTGDGNFTDTCKITVTEADIIDDDKTPTPTPTPTPDLEDDTKVPLNKLPETGKKITLIVLIIISGIVAVVTYKKKELYNF